MEKDEISNVVAQLGVYDNTALAEVKQSLRKGEQMPAQGEVQTIVDGVVQTALPFSKTSGIRTISTRHTGRLLTIMTSPLAVSAEMQTLPAQECTFIMT